VPPTDDPKFRTEEPLTPFKVRATYKVVPASLPRCASACAIASARAPSISPERHARDDPIADTLALAMGFHAG